MSCRLVKNPGGALWRGAHRGTVVYGVCDRRRGSSNFVVMDSDAAAPAAAGGVSEVAREPVPLSAPPPAADDMYEEVECRICRGEAEVDNVLYVPLAPARGSLVFVLLPRPLWCGCGVDPWGVAL